jgi:hypothetical protein
MAGDARVRFRDDASRDSKAGLALVSAGPAATCPPPQPPATTRATCPNRSAAPSSAPAPGVRLDRLPVIAGHPSILAAAQALGLWQATLYEQVARLERACGGPLVNRGRRPARTVILTPPGQQLCQQSRDYLAC